MLWIDNSLEKLGQAIQVWKTATGPWGVRLGSALTWVTRILSAKDLPEEFRPRFTELIEAATRVKDERHGAIRATVNHMDEGEANRLMSSVERLYNELSAYKFGQR